MYLEYFRLTENPFSIAPDPQFRYQGRREREAMAHLQYGLSVSGGFIQLTGEVGTGKTMLIRALLEELPDEVDVALILNPAMTVLEFVAAICDELRIRYKRQTNSLKTFVDLLNQYLLKNHARGRRTVLIMDEAQNLSREVLEQVRLLTNLETSKHKLLQIILVGQQELNDKLSSHDLRQLAQRIIARYTLGSLTKKETREYISHRCKVAGASHPLFTRSAMAWVYRLARGNPRMTNIICDRALLGAYSDDVPLADGQTVRKAALEVGSSVPGRFWRRQWAAVAAAAVAGVTLVLVLWQGWMVNDLAGNDPLASATNSLSPAQQQIVSSLPTKQASKVSLDRPNQVSAAASNTGGLDKLLASSAIAGDTSLIFGQLFTLWGLQRTVPDNQTGCEAAKSEGLACIFNTGTWNNLRTYNRPALIELIAKNGQRHHVLVTGIDKDNVSVSLGDAQYVFPLAAVDRYWYGKYLLVWRPQPLVHGVLREGLQGPSITWLREALAHYFGTPLENQSDLFDSTLKNQVIAFQKKHQLAADGVVGRITLMWLNTYALEHKPPTLLKGATVRVAW